MQKRQLTLKNRSCPNSRPVFRRGFYQRAALIQTDELRPMFKFLEAAMKKLSSFALLFFHGFFNNSSRIQQLRFGQPRTDQLQTGNRNAESVRGRDRHGQGRVAGEIHRHGILDLKDMRIDDAQIQVEDGEDWRCFLKSGERDDVDLLENFVERLLPCPLPLNRTAIRRVVSELTGR